jgi:hypothetical protein
MGKEHHWREAAQVIRVHVICEGQTEEMFVKELLADKFIPRDIFLAPTLIGKPGHKGGNVKFERLLTDVRARLLADKKSYCTTFFDFYGLPDNFPGKAEATQKGTAAQKARTLLNALTKTLQGKLGADPMRRFIPYVQMYEFEGLLFSDPKKLAQGMDQEALEAAFQKIRNDFESPEDINNNSLTAPSKRIMTEFPAYDKPIHGSLAAMEIGLKTIRRECPQFDAWIRNLENLHDL